MPGKNDREYVSKHEQIIKKLEEMADECNCGCFEVAKIAVALGMDQRTVRSHLKILEVSHVGVFVNVEEKEFCTRAGLAILARRLGLKVTADEQ